MTGDRHISLLWLGVVLVASYMVTQFTAVPFPAVAIWKAAGIICFGAYAYLNGARLGAAGLFFSAAGDVALALPTANFVAGMVFFGIAHLLYTAVFYRIIKEHGANPRWLPGAALIPSISLALLVWFWPDMGALTVPGHWLSADYHRDGGLCPDLCRAAKREDWCDFSSCYPTP